MQPDSKEEEMDRRITDASQTGSDAELKFIRLKEVLSICGKSRSSVYEAIRMVHFPRRSSLVTGLLAGSRAKSRNGPQRASRPLERRIRISRTVDRVTEDSAAIHVGCSALPDFPCFTCGLAPAPDRPTLRYRCPERPHSGVSNHRRVLSIPQACITRLRNVAW